jgi:hypothetical protein
LCVGSTEVIRASRTAVIPPVHSPDARWPVAGAPSPRRLDARALFFFSRNVVLHEHEPKQALCHGERKTWRSRLVLVVAAVSRLGECCAMIRDEHLALFGSKRRHPGLVGIRGRTLAVVGEEPVGEEPVGEEPSFRIMEATLATNQQ